MSVVYQFYGNCQRYYNRLAATIDRNICLWYCNQAPIRQDCPVTSFANDVTRDEQGEKRITCSPTKRRKKDEHASAGSFGTWFSGRDRHHRAVRRSWNEHRHCPTRPTSAPWYQQRHPRGGGRPRPLLGSAVSGGFGSRKVDHHVRPTKVRRVRAELQRRRQIPSFSLAVAVLKNNWATTQKRPVVRRGVFFFLTTTHWLLTTKCGRNFWALLFWRQNVSDRTFLPLRCQKFCS